MFKSVGGGMKQKIFLREEGGGGSRLPPYLLN